MGGSSSIGLQHPEGRVQYSADSRNTSPLVRERLHPEGHSGGHHHHHHGSSRGSSGMPESAGVGAGGQSLPRSIRPRRLEMTEPTVVSSSRDEVDHHHHHHGHGRPGEHVTPMEVEPVYSDNSLPFDPYQSATSSHQHVPNRTVHSVASQNPTRPSQYSQNPRFRASHSTAPPPPPQPTPRDHHQIPLTATASTRVLAYDVPGRPQYDRYMIHSEPQSTVVQPVSILTSLISSFPLPVLEI